MCEYCDAGDLTSVEYSSYSGRYGGGAIIYDCDYVAANLYCAGSVELPG